MTSNKTKKIAWLLSLLLTLSFPTTNALSATDSELLKACDAALTAKIKEADLCDYGIKIREDARVMDQKEIADLRAARSAWYNNPMFWAAVGVIAGTYIGARVTK